MADLRIMNRFEAEDYCEKRHLHTSVVISIADYKGLPANIDCTQKNKVQAIHREYFQDSEIVDKTTITMEQAQNIANFYNKWKDKVDVVIVHCNGGVSRSSAIVASFQRLETNHPSVFDNPYKHPNALVYLSMLKALKIQTDNDAEWDLLIQSDINYRAKNGRFRF